MAVAAEVEKYQKQIEALTAPVILQQQAAIKYATRHQAALEQMLACSSVYSVPREPELRCLARMPDVGVSDGPELEPKSIVRPELTRRIGFAVFAE